MEDCEIMEKPLEFSYRAKAACLDPLLTQSFIRIMDMINWLIWLDTPALVGQVTRPVCVKLQANFIAPCFSQKTLLDFHQK